MASIKFELKISPNLDAEKLKEMLNNLKASLNDLGEDIKIVDGDKLKQEYNKVDAEINKTVASTKRVVLETDKLEQSIQSVSTAGSLMNKAFAFNQIVQSMQMLGTAMQDYTQPFINFQKGLADFSAITGVSGDALEEFGNKARAMAQEFGGSAITQIEAMKGVLSRLGPDIAKSPEALERMTKAINTISAASGLDATASMNALTSSLLQFDVSLDDPIQAAGEMEKMMNVLAAGAKEGAAEIPQVADAIVVAGVAAKGAKVSFEETNAAIQVLAAGGKYGAEAGTALRNVLGLIQKASGPAEESMRKMGTSSRELGEILTTKGLGEAIKKLQEGMNGLGTDAEKNVALMQIFGTENAAAAGILIKKAEDITELTGKISGTSTAFEQANINMDTTAARIERFKATMEDAFITVFQTVGENVTFAINALGQMSPVLGTLAGIKQIIPDSAFDSIKNLPGSLNKALPSVQQFSQRLLSTLLPSLASIGTTGVTAFGAVGTASATAGTVATTAGTSTAMAWATALSPILAIVAAVGLVGAIFYLLYTQVESFRNMIDGFVSIFVYGFERSAEVLTRFWNIILSFGEAIFTYLTAPFQVAWNIISSVIGSFVDLGSSSTVASSAIQVLGTAFDYVLKALSFVQAGFEGFTASLDSIISSLSGVITKVLQGDIVGAVQELSSAGNKAGEAFNTSFTQKLQENSLVDFKNGLERDLAGGIEIQTKINTAESIPKLVKDIDDIKGQLKPLEIKIQTGTASDDEKKLFDDLNKRAQDIANKLQTVSPNAVSGVKTWIDANGNLQETYEINTEKAIKLAEENKKTISNELIGKMNEFSSKLLEQSSIYDQQKQKLSQIQEQIRNAKSTEEVKKLTVAYNEQKKKMDETGAAIKEGYEKGAKAGLLTADAISKIETQFGFSKGTAEQLKKVQEEQTSEGKLTAEAIAGIAEAFNSAKTAADNAKKAQVSAQAQLVKDFKEGKITQEEYNKKTKESIDNYKKLAKESKNFATAEAEANKILGTEESKKAQSSTTSKKNKESEYSLSNKLLENYKKSSKIELDSVENQNEMIRLAQNRDKTTLDDLAIQQRKLASMESEKQKLLELFKISLDNDGNIVKIGIKAETEEKTKITNEFKTLVNDIEKETNKEFELKAKVNLNEEDLAEELRKQNLQQLKYEIELGIKERTDIIPVLQQNLNSIQDKISNLEGIQVKLEITAESTPEQQANYEYLTKTINDLKAKELTAKRELSEENKKIYAIEMKDLQEKHKSELAEIQNRINQEKILTGVVASATEEVGTSLAVQRKESDLQQLEQLKERELISEQDYNKRKQAIEEEHQTKLKLIKEASKGYILEAERQYTIQLLQEQEKQLQIERQKAQESGDTEKMKQLDEQLQELSASIQEKGDILKAYSTELQSTITEAFSNLFQGDFEDVKEPFKKLFSVIAGALKKYVSLLATEMVFGELKKYASTGLYSLVLIPVFQGIVSSALDAILNPVLDGITSFSTGGRVDEPTLAIVGDASNSRSGSDTEWIMRDDHLWTVINAAIKTALTTNNREIEMMTKTLINEIDLKLTQEETDLLTKSAMQEIISNVDFAQMNNFDITPMTNEISNLVESLKNIEPFFKKSELNVENLMKLSEEYIKISSTEKLYSENKLTEEQYLNQLQTHYIKVKSFAGGSGFLTQPQLAIVGDAGTNNPEIVLNNPQLQSIINQASTMSTKNIEKKLDSLISAFNNIQLRAVIADVRQATDEINRENNRRKF